MKLKTLAKAVAKKLGDDGVKDKDVRKLIAKCDKFSVDGKLISLNDSDGSGKGKRKSTTNDVEDEAEKKAAKKARKNEKKVNSDTEGSSASLSSPDLDSVAAWRKEHKIVLKDTTEDGSKDAILNADPNIFPLSSFESDECKASIAPVFLSHCTNVHKFTTPSPIQAQCWPILSSNSASNSSSGRDVVGIAETGSGKTLAFALPALTSMHNQDTSNKVTTNKHRSKKLPRLLVLAPTRELAMQSHQVLVEYAELVGMKSLVVYGGVPKHSQRDVLRKGVDCLVATPGRLKDLINENTCDLSQVSHLVLDEADRMLDMGFEEDVRFIISNCMSKEDNRQTYMFSATWPAGIQKLAMEYMTNPVRVYVGFEAIVGSNGENAIDDSLSANKRVTQICEVIEDRAREARLRVLLQKYHKTRNNRILVFALYKKEAQRLENNLRRDGWKCCSIHGDKNQEARTKALSEFKDGSNPLMIATDVAARGLDIPNVEFVVNFTFPLTIEDYVHRIGRTGRAGKTGVSHTFFQTGDKSHAGELQQVMRQAGQEVPQELMNFGSTIKKKEHNLYGSFGPRGGGPMKKATKITFD